MSDNLTSKEGVSGRSVSVWETPSTPCPPRELKTYTFEALRETFEPGDLVSLLLDEIERLQREAEDRSQYVSHLEARIRAAGIEP